MRVQLSFLSASIVFKVVTQQKKIAPQSDCIQQQIKGAVLLSCTLKTTMCPKRLTTLLDRKSRRFIALSSLCFTPVFTPIWE